MRQALDPARWKVLSRYLDEVLDLSSADRPGWLASLRTRDTVLADELEKLLAAYGRVEVEGFLERDPARWPTLAGQTLGAYTLRTQIGQGGMGSVWLAGRSDGRYEGVAAVKLLNASLIGQGAEDRFRREGSILARLRHRHIAHLIDAGVSPAGQPYLVLEHVDGEHVDAYCDRRRLGIRERVRLFLDVLAAVSHAHANLIVHRDLKPSNVLVDREGTVKLLDFGVAKLLTLDTVAAPPTLTGEGGCALTLEYAAPEQLVDGDITTATDVFALGVVLYELLAGRHPAGSSVRGSPGELFRAILDREPARLSAAETPEAGPSDHARARSATRGTTPEGLRRALRGDLETIVAKALKKGPIERYPSVAALAEDLRRYLEHSPITARPDTLGYRAAKFVRRHRLPVALASMLLLALSAGLTGTFWQARAAARQRDLALAQLVRAEAMNDFTEFLLGEAVPAGKRVTMHELLVLAERLVEKRFAADEALAVELLVTIGGIYDALDETDNAQRATQRAYEASRRLSDPAVRASASCGRALTLAHMGDYPEAQRLIDTALDGISNDARFDGIAAGCLTYKGHIASMEGDGETAVRSARKALDRLRAVPGAFANTRVIALSVLAIGYYRLGEQGQADRAFAESMHQLERLGQADTTGAATLLNNWALVRQTSDALAALALQQRAIDGIRQDEDSAESTPASFLINEGRFLNQLARFQEAKRVLERASEASRAHQNLDALGAASVGLARACRGLGDLARSHETLRAAEEALSARPAGHLSRAELLHEQGMLASARGRDVEARRLLTQALRLHETAPRRVPHIETLLELADLELRAGRRAEAEQHAQTAFGLSEHLREDRPHSAWVGLSQLALGKVHRARGEGAAARRLFSQAAGHLAVTLGEAHPATQDAQAQLSP